MQINKIDLTLTSNLTLT